MDLLQAAVDGAAGGDAAAVISQYDKDDVEAIGLVKFDFLGLTTLTILDLTLRYVRRLDPSFALTLESLPLDDARTYEVFKQAGLIEYLPWAELSPENLAEKVTGLINNPKRCCHGIAAFKFTGLEVISARLAEFRGLAT